MTRPALMPAALVAAALAASSPAAAAVTIQDVKISRTTDTYEVEVAYPRTGVAAIDGELYAWATAKADDFISLAETDRQDMPDRPGMQYTLYVTYEVARNDDSILAVLFHESTYTGGAHPNSDMDTFNYVMPTGWRIFLPEIFNGKAALERISALAVTDLTEQLGGPDGMSDSDWIGSGAGPAWTNFEDFLLLAASLEIEFPPYQVAAYAAGPQHVSIPLSELQGSMRADWYQPVASFDCAAAGTATEKAICSDVWLARLDRQVADAYQLDLRYAVDDAARDHIRTEQRAWLGTRNQCGGDTACLTGVYQARLQALQAS